MEEMVVDLDRGAPVAWTGDEEEEVEETLGGEVLSVYEMWEIAEGIAVVGLTDEGVVFCDTGLQVRDCICVGILTVELGHYDRSIRRIRSVTMIAVVQSNSAVGRFITALIMRSRSSQHQHS